MRVKVPPSIFIDSDGFYLGPLQSDRQKKSVRFPSLHSGANHVDLKRSVWEEHQFDKKKKKYREREKIS